MLDYEQMQDLGALLAEDGTAPGWLSEACALADSTGGPVAAGGMVFLAERVAKQLTVAGVSLPAPVVGMKSVANGHVIVVSGQYDPDACTAPIEVVGMIW
ncbi:hypothetical protein [Parafrankia sp. EUN1f]|uniref:hypothetical protein n=1 Tax=Parafrankia sp. EUN1f TaxID=102897 RepID=UPI0018DCECE4|nr:hypothetical protein [Parafrankia sp. EUN1f]